MLPAMKRKYQSWGEFLKKRRESHYRSAREFCARATVEISYPQYSRYEAGDQLPNLEQALHLCHLLEVPMLEGLMEWCRAQMSDATARREVEVLLDQIRANGGSAPVLPSGKPAIAQASSLANGGKVAGIGVFTAATINLDDVIVFNRSHLRLFSSDPVYRDIFTYINSYAPEWISITEIGAALGVPLAKMEKMVEQLSDLGVVLLAGEKCRATKRNFYFPDDPDFFPLRNMNLTHNTASIMRRLKHEDLLARRAYRGLVTRELTNDQLDRVVTRIDELVSDVVAMPETPNPERIYSLCLLLGERFERPAQYGKPARVGLRREETASKVPAVEA